MSRPDSGSSGTQAAAGVRAYVRFCGSLWRVAVRRSQGTVAVNGLLINDLLVSLRPHARLVELAFLVFFLSGFAAVLYQVIWQRLLVFFSGADVYSITIIVAAFMAGLGLGNVGGGKLADRLGPASSLKAFAAAELAIGIFGFFSKFLFYDVLYTQLPQLGDNIIVATIVLFASLLVPTCLMGVSLPLLSRALTHDVGDAGRIIGSLYGWNTLGAAAGAFATTWILIPNIGLEGALLWGAASNVLCAIGAFAIGALSPVRHTTAIVEPDNDRGRAFPALPFSSWILVYALTGLIALGFEITWFRLLGVVQKSTAFTFGTVLAVYLAGLGLGGAIGSRFVHRGIAPGRVFLLHAVRVDLVRGGLDRDDHVGHRPRQPQQAGGLPRRI